MKTNRLTFLAISLFIPLLLGLALATAVAPQPAHAAPNIANPIVTTLTDEQDGECTTDCSLRDAIDLADSGSTITFDITGTIVLSSSPDYLGELVIDKDLIIDGGNVITVSGNNATRVFNVMTSTLSANVAVTFDSLSIISGSVQITNCGAGAARCSGGGMIQNSGVAVTVTNSTLSGNLAFYGGGIFNGGGALMINNSTFFGNRASYGGGIFNDGTNGLAMVEIDNSALSGNLALYGSGILNDGTNGSATLMVTNSTLSDNTSHVYGGGIFNDGTNGLATVMVTNSILSRNWGGTGGGGIFNDGTNGLATLIVTNSTLSGNAAENGGGIYNPGGTVTVNNSTLSGNVSAYGGGIYNPGGMVTVNNSTLSGNGANYNGGGIYNNGGTLTVNNSTLFGNRVWVSGGGISSVGDEYTFTTISNTIVSRNFVMNTANTDDVSLDDSNSTDSFTSGGHNLIGTIGTGITAFTGTSDIINTLPRLGPLADNGGATFTHAPLVDSPAIDTGTCSGLTTDQRGVARPQNGVCDIGAVEARLFLTLNVVGSGSVTQDPTQADYEYGTVVTVTAVADAGWLFAGWSGHLSGSAISETVIITGNIAITATFNAPPIASAGGDQTVKTNQTITLDGSGSTDNDGHLPLTYSWVQTGDPKVSLSSAAAISPTFTAPTSQTTLTFTLTVMDSLGAVSTPDAVVITVEPYFIFLPTVLMNK